jgi:hypothetical protein
MFLTCKAPQDRARVDASERSSILAIDAYGIDMGKMRLPIARSCQELKQEVGLGHFEGRVWHGLTHHAMRTHARMPLQDVT